MAAAITVPPGIMSGIKPVHSEMVLEGLSNVSTTKLNICSLIDLVFSIAVPFISTELFYYLIHSVKFGFGLLMLL